MTDKYMNSFSENIPWLFCFDYVSLQPLQIKSAIAVEGLKGYIYIEAYKQTHVKQVRGNISFTTNDAL